jgi:hypothetical protein
MPQQQVFFEQKSGDRRIEVLKVYDRSYAREAFGNMDEAAQKYLWNSLGINENYDAADLPPIHDPAGEDFLWEELLDAAREDGNLLSFFVVNEAKGGTSQSLYDVWLGKVRAALNSINMPMEDWQATWHFDFEAEYKAGAKAEDVALSANRFWWREQNKSLKQNCPVTPDCWLPRGTSGRLPAGEYRNAKSVS